MVFYLSALCFSLIGRPLLFSSRYLLISLGSGFGQIHRRIALALVISLLWVFCLFGFFFLRFSSRRLYSEGKVALEMVCKDANAFLLVHIALIVIKD